MQNVTGVYDELMGSAESINESMINTFTGTDKTARGSVVAKLISRIEKTTDFNKLLKLKIELADLIVDYTTDDVFQVATEIFEKGPI